MERALECSMQVPELVRLMIDDDQPAVRRQAKAISRLEGLADEAKNDIRANMPTRLFLPVDRRDVLRLVRQIDSIADASEDVGVLATLRPMDVPEKLQEPLTRFVQASVECVQTAAKLVDTLEPLLSSGFSGRATEQTSLIIDALSRQEHETDKIQDQLAKTLFQIENEMSPVAVIMWLKIFEEIGNIANHSENVGDLFRLFVAR